MDTKSRLKVPKENITAIKIWFGTAILAVILIIVDFEPAFCLLTLSVFGIFWAGWPIRKQLFPPRKKRGEQMNGTKALGLLVIASGFLYLFLGGKESWLFFVAGALMIVIGFLPEKINFKRRP